MSSANDFRVSGSSTKLSATAIAAHIAMGLGRGLDGAYYEYREGIWVRDPDAVTRLVAALLGDDYTETLKRQIEAHLLGSPDVQQVGVRNIKGGQLEHIVLANGVYYWQYGDLMPHDMALRALTRLPIMFDFKADCPTFASWLSAVLSDDTEVVEHVWEILGYILMTGNPFQKAILLHGEGRNGKGTLLRVLEHLLGEDNYSAISLHTLVEDRFAAAGLYGKIANISGDLSDKFVRQPEIIKQITGGDAITAAHKYGQQFTFVPYAVPVFAANELFRSSDTSHGWRRRWLVVDFRERYDEGSFDERTLFDEAPGIFNRAMDALRRLMERGRFDPPQRAIEAATKLHDDGDPFVMWLEEDESVSLIDDASTPTADVYTRYSKWSRENGYQPLASGPFGKRLADRGIRQTRPREGASRVRHYAGIAVFLKTTD